MDGKHGNDLAVLLSSGFKAGKTSNTPAAHVIPEIKKVKNGNSGQLLPKIGPIENAAGFEPRSALVNPDGTQGPWVMGGFSKSARCLALNGLTPGAMYAMPITSTPTGATRCRTGRSEGRVGNQELTTDDQKPVAGDPQPATGS